MAPWFRTLGNIWARELRSLGVEVLVVTTENHFEPLPRRDGEIVLVHRPRSVAGTPEYVHVRRAVRRFDADVVLTEQFRDPRLAFLVEPGVPHVLMVHDAHPHDETHSIPWQRRAVMGVVERRVVATVAFSRAVAEILEGSNPNRSVTVVPLPSEMSDYSVPPFVPSGQRRDFYCVGRLRPYKNLALVAEAWERHVNSTAYRGDTLRIIGSGELGVELPVRSEWSSGPFSFPDVAPRLASGKGSIAMYSAGSQSGVQLFSMQVGCPPIVSAVGGFGEYQISSLPPLDPGDVGGLVARIDQLCDPAIAADLGAACVESYREGFSAKVSAQGLVKVLDQALARHPGRV